MLSIHFGNKQEWWTNGKSFERFIEAIIASNNNSFDWEYLYGSVSANGGMHLSEFGASELQNIVQVFRSITELELIRLGKMESTPANQIYSTSLLKLRDILKNEG